MLLRPALLALAVLLTSSLAACTDDPALQPDATVAPVEPDAAGVPDAQADPDAGTPDATTPPPDATTTPPADATTTPPDAQIVPDAALGGSGPAIVSFTNPFIDHFADDLTGFRFTVGATNLTVTDLGFFDQGGNGLGEAHAVGIYDVGSQQLIVSATLPAGTEAALDGAFRYVPLATPGTLTANTTYVAVAYRTTAVDGVAYQVSNLKVSPLLTYNSNVAANGSEQLAFCNTPFNNNPNSWFGPNFKVSP